MDRLHTVRLQPTRSGRSFAPLDGHLRVTGTLHCDPSLLDIRVAQPSQYTGVMPSSAKRSTRRRVNIVQFLALIVAIAVIGSLIGVLGAGLALPAIGAMGATARAVPQTFEELPDDLVVIQPAEASRMLDADGNVLAMFFTERRTIVNSDQIAQVMKDATVAIEDWRFYTHHGVDPDGMARALFNNVVLKGDTQGASTITQQYVKNILVNKGIQEGDQDLIEDAQEQTAERKLREARYAVALESQMSKDDILTGYLNMAAFGNNTYGVEAASRTYFSKSASELTLPEAAMLAGSVQSPGDYDALVNPEKAETRRNEVLYAMETRGYITAEERDAAIAIPIEEMLNPDHLVSGCSSAGNRAYFCEYALVDFLKDETFGATDIERQHLLNTGGLTIRTTIKPWNQDSAYQAIVDRVPVDGASGVDTALVSMDPRTGYILAMAQNTRYGIESQDDPRATVLSYNVDQEHRGGTGFQPGSTFKVFTLVQWFAQNRSAYEQVGRENRTFRYGDFKCGGQPQWMPEDYRVADIGGKNGKFDVVRATALSVNQAFMDMASKVEFCQIFEKAYQMGVVDGHTGEMPNVMPSGIIGTSSTVTPLSLATGYATLANRGTRCEPMSITEIEGPDGSIIKTNTPTCTPVLDPTVADQVSTLLSMSAATYEDQIGRPMAAKTGTTDLNDNTWLAGYVPQLVAVTWTGHANASATPLRDITIGDRYYDYVYGSTISGPIWAQYMRWALEGVPVEPLPSVFIGNVPPPPAPPTQPSAGGGAAEAAPVETPTETPVEEVPAE